LLTGRPPFRGDRPAAVAYQHISEQAPAPSGLNPRVSPALDAVVLHALSKDKFDRFQTAGEFRADLDAAAAGNVPVHKPAGDFNATLFGVNPHAVAGSEATLRQLSATSDERLVRTQTRPPVAWIWAGVTIVAVIIAAVMFWVLTFQQEPIGADLSVKVPGVVGAQYEDGAQTLTKLGLVPNRFGVSSDTVAAGEITRTDPKPGTVVGKRQVVKVWVSLGKNPVAVPMLRNMPEANAVSTLEAAKLNYGRTDSEYSPTVPAGIVLRSEPDAGFSAHEGDTVNLFVSNGMVKVPTVTGLPVGTATATLTALGLDVTPRQDKSCSGDAVTSQSLPAGDQPQRSKLTVTYCSG
jgi:eukaryotic-like serine/threonine-protein kinase